MNKSNMAYPVDGMVTSFGKCLCVCIVVYISGVIPVIPCTDNHVFFITLKLSGI